jgi:hypothetical protein
MWARGYFCCSAGNVTVEIIAGYIARQQDGRRHYNPACRYLLRLDTKLVVRREYAKGWRWCRECSTMVLGPNKMTIKYTDGRTVQGAILSRSDNVIRAALKVGDGAVKFTRLNGTWIAEDREPVQIEFAWQRHSRSEVVAEADGICSKELASRLILCCISSPGSGFE